MNMGGIGKTISNVAGKAAKAGKIKSIKVKMKFKTDPQPAKQDA